MKERKTSEEMSCNSSLHGKMPLSAFLAAYPIRSNTVMKPSACTRRNVAMKRSIDANGGEFIRLDNFIKLQGAATTGGQAKVMIIGGEVVVNGEVETRRGRKLREGDTVRVDGIEVPVAFDENEDL